MSDKRELDVDLLTRVASSAAARATRGSPNLREDIESELLLWALENKEDRLRNYLHEGLPERERANKLFVTLVRQASKIVSKSIKRSQVEVSYSDAERVIESISDDHDSLLPRFDGAVAWRVMTQEEVIELLPFIHLDDINVPRDYRLHVSLVRNAVAYTTKAQREIITRLGRGMTYAEIGEELGISPSTARKRFSRARLTEHCRVPIFPDHKP